MRDNKLIQIRVSETDFKRFKILADDAKLKMSEYFRMLIQINYSIKMAAEGKEAPNLEAEYGFQINEEFVHDFVRNMGAALEGMDINNALKLNTTKPYTHMKQTFKKAKKVA